MKGNCDVIENLLGETIYLFKKLNGMMSLHLGDHGFLRVNRSTLS
jgi:hypothetical protein